MQIICSLIITLVSIASYTHTMHQQAQSQLCTLPQDLIPYIVNTGNYQDLIPLLSSLQRTCKLWNVILSKDYAKSLIASIVLYDKNIDLEDGLYKSLLKIRGEIILNEASNTIFSPELYIKAGADLNQNQHTFSLLATAAHNKTIRYLKMFITLGANINQQDKRGNTPLHHACRHNSLESVQLLLAHNANPLITNQWKKVPTDHLRRSLSPIHNEIQNQIRSLLDAHSPLKKNASHAIHRRRNVSQGTYTS